MPPEGVPYLDIKEFCDTGYLQEVNRIFFHPLGLALEVTVEEDGSQRISGIWDCRDDREGVYFDEIDQDKYKRIREENFNRYANRYLALGYYIQPPK